MALSRKKLGESIDEAFKELFMDEKKMQYIVCQGGFEKYFQFEIASLMNSKSFNVDVEARKRTDILIYKNQSENKSPKFVVEIGAGYVSQTWQRQKPQTDRKKYIKDSGEWKDSYFSGAEFYSLMLLAEKVGECELPKNCKQRGYLDAKSVKIEYKWENDGFKIERSWKYKAGNVELNVSLLRYEAT